MWPDNSLVGKKASPIDYVIATSVVITGMLSGLFPLIRLTIT